METSHILNFIRRTFNDAEGFIPLHAPFFGGKEKEYVTDTIDSTFVSSVGAYVTRFEEMMTEITGARYAIATVNGTTALHLALVLAGVKYGEEVITQSLTFVATANAIAHAGAIPVFTDVDKDTMGLSPAALQAFLEEHVMVNANGECINKTSGRRIAACVPMHTFGFPLRISELAAVCSKYNIPLVEDAAESLGSYVGDKHTGTFGLIGTFSFNGNKTVTCGGGGAIVTNDEAIAKKAKHLSTTAKIPHAYEFVHDDIGYNYRMPNLNAALACAQLEQLDAMLANKRELAEMYSNFFQGSSVSYVKEMYGTKANYWLNTVIFQDHAQQQAFLKESNDNKVMTRPIWRLMNRLPMYAHCQHGDLSNAEWLEERVVNIPSSVRK
ncbi:LegC family aminotransferase [Chitinophaga ginsengisoli]|uniref:Aminotransferase in exopolysaccharide biosynthesis n=1 Tax=Chitinophaga ginsengisoli TaxID=363837 RepID=A0A2P8GPH2_9BACT|nr:LegC family aminotransferase [Chitinophaga ginsengisoli]PSL35863.1 aminotransferase in exopolysaccharide biosynthesis [Chitinophaga ginsengisoli]